MWRTEVRKAALWPIAASQHRLPPELSWWNLSRTANRKMVTKQEKDKMEKKEWSTERERSVASRCDRARNEVEQRIYFFPPALAAGAAAAAAAGAGALRIDLASMLTVLPYSV